jgi:tetratricopeptide (TPR) repeat protein
VLQQYQQQGMHYRAHHALVWEESRSFNLAHTFDVAYFARLPDWLAQMGISAYSVHAGHYARSTDPAVAQACFREHIMRLGQMCRDRGIRLGVTYNSLSQYQRAIDYYQQALPIFHQVGDHNGEAGALNNLGAVYDSLGQYQRAIDYYQRALPIFHQMGNHNGEAQVITHLGIAYAYLRQYQRAIDYFQRALPIYRQVGDRDNEGWLLANIGRLYANQNSPQSAIQQLQRSVEVRESIRADLRGLPQADQQAYTNRIADDYRLLAELLRQQNRNQEAQVVLNLLNP